MAAPSETPKSASTGGHLVACALKAEGIKAIFALASESIREAIRGRL